MSLQTVTPDRLASSPAREAWIGKLARMLAVDTSFPPGAGYSAFADLLEEFVEPLGFTCERVSVPPELWQTEGSHGERVNLIARRAPDRPVCSIYFHVDTVPAGEDWTTEPFALTRRGDRLIGRGAADMKGTIAAALLAIESADAAGLSYAFEPHLLFCTDEEGGKYPGVRYLAERGLVEGHVLCLNGSAAPRIWAGCFGSVDLLVRIEGRAAHSGEGRDGVTALEAAVPILSALVALKRRVEARTSVLPGPPDREGLLHGRLTVAGVRGGGKGSAVPALCTINVNRRYAPEEDVDAVVAELERAIESARGAAVSVTTEIVGHLTPVVDPDDGPHWPRWQRALGAGFGFSPGEFRRWGASSGSDMGFVQAAGRREILLGGLGRPDRRIHAADEFTTVADVEALAAAIRHYLTDPPDPL
jgi:succinyl-diaminopimelate desuccinylase